MTGGLQHRRMDSTNRIIQNLLALVQAGLSHAVVSLPLCHFSIRAEVLVCCHGDAFVFIFVCDAKVSNQHLSVFNIFYVAGGGKEGGYISSLTSVYSVPKTYRERVLVSHMPQRPPFRKDGRWGPGRGGGSPVGFCRLPPGVGTSQSLHGTPLGALAWRARHPGLRGAGFPSAAPVPSPNRICLNNRKDRNHLCKF